MDKEDQDQKGYKKFKEDSLLFNRIASEHLKACRKAAGHTMRSLAAVLDPDMPHSFIGKLEKLKRRMDIGEFERYCDAMRLDAAKEYGTILQKVKVERAKQQEEHTA